MKLIFDVFSQYLITLDDERYHIIAIPKTTHLKRMKENIDIFDFQLDKEDKKQIEQFWVLLLHKQETIPIFSSLNFKFS